MNRLFVSLAVGLLLLAGIACLLGSAASFMSDRFSMYFGGELLRERLVYHTDHHAVLEACRRVTKDPASFGFPPATNGVWTMDGSQSGGAVSPQLPAVLRNLQFEDMNIHGDDVAIYFGGGFGHWGFSTAAGESPNAEWQMIPGLWYFSEGGMLPRDSAKNPYYRTSKALLAAGVAGIVAACAIAMSYFWKKRSLRIESETS